jgi:hypothetical protein
MPYKSKAEQESERWVTLPEAVEHISSIDNISLRQARRELLKALKNGAFYSPRVRLIRWKSTIEISGRIPAIALPDDPPRGQEWSHSRIRWTSGRVLDPYGALKNGKWVPTWRVVWLLRSKVIRLWPESRRLFDAAASAGGPVLGQKNKARGRPPEYNWTRCQSPPDGVCARKWSRQINE